MKRLTIALAMLLAVMASAQNSPAAGYPRAEWSRAADILMHTPGQELFCASAKLVSTACGCLLRIC